VYLLTPRVSVVGSVTISFHGVVKVRFVDTDPHRVHGVHTLNHYENNDYDSEDVLFAETKLLYQGKSRYLTTFDTLGMSYFYLR
jgi:hypothetical protein